jgi:hypothetical protein
MGEQNRRAVEVEGAPGDAARRSRRRRAAHAGPADPAAGRALGVEADERQTVRQAPAGATPGEGAEDDTIG